MPKPPLMMRLPRGLREQPAWVFIGILIAFSGLSFASGYAESMVAKAIGNTGLRVWGVILTFSGILLTIAVIRARASLEKLALRVMTWSLLAYGGYLLTVVPFKRAAMSVALTLILCGLAEFRVMVLKVLIVRASMLAKELGEPDNG